MSTKDTQLPNKGFSHPLEGRYASPAMQEILSESTQFSTWRLLWWKILEQMNALGLISAQPEHLQKMRDILHLINMQAARDYEKRLRHDVMAHVRAFQDLCRQNGLEDLAKLIHLGLTSCDITDNAKLIIQRQGLVLVRKRLAELMYRLAGLAETNADLICAGFTHQQVAQPTTLGKRFAMWLFDLDLVYRDLDRIIKDLPFRGIKDATGTQQSLMQLAKGDTEKVLELETAVAREFEFNQVLPVTGQTYSRLIDADMTMVLAKLGSALHKIFADVRTLAMLDHLHEPFGDEQIGSSAQAYKQNPMRSERGDSLALMLMGLANPSLHIHATQIMERTLNDSAAGRIANAESLLYADAILLIANNVFDGLRIFPQRITAHLESYLPFFATVAIMNEMTEKHGADRQEMHELLRKHAVASVTRYREEGTHGYDMLERLQTDPILAPIHEDPVNFLDPQTMIGRAPEQARCFAHEIRGKLKNNHSLRDLTNQAADLKV